MIDKSLTLIDTALKSNGVVVFSTLETGRNLAEGILKRNQIFSWKQLLAGKLKEERRPIYIDETAKCLRKLAPSLRGMSMGEEDIVDV